jgi:PhnB protein
MARTSNYLNFPGTTEAAFTFYKSVFGTEYLDEITRFGDVPASGDEEQPALSEEQKNLVMHVALPITGGHILMGTDAVEAMGFKLNQGNNVYLNLEPDTREEADRLFQALSAEGKIETPMQEMFWGAYYGACRDRFGINWMVNCANN